MFVAAWMLNPLCLALAPLALVFLVGYSYTKRFTWASHWILGFTDGIAAAGGWIAVRGAFEPPAFVHLVRAHRLDRRLRPDLRLPGRRDRPRPGAPLRRPPASACAAALHRGAASNHALTALALAVLGWHAGARRPLLGRLAGGGRAASSTSTRWCGRRDLSRLDVAFFNVNGYIAVIVLVAVVTGLR